MAVPNAVLCSLLLSHKLVESVVNVVTVSRSRGLGCESVSHFAGSWAHNTADFYKDLRHVDAFTNKSNRSKYQLSQWRIA